MSNDDFYIPTAEELDHSDASRKGSRQRAPLPVLKGRRATRQGDFDVPEDVGTRKKVREPGRRNEHDDLLDTGSTGRIVRSIDATDASAKVRRDLIIPPELRDKYGLED